MDLNLDGARAVICGASSGLGAAVAETLASEGVRCCLIARSKERLEAIAAKTGGFAYVADLSTADGPGTAIGHAIGQLGGLDLLVVNSGGPPTGSFIDVDDDTWDEAIDGTLKSAFRVIRGALEYLRRSERPAILLILSSTVREPVAGLVTSNVLRPGLAGLVKTLVTEIAPIRINAIAPGRVSTPRLLQLEAHQATAAGVSVDEIRRRTIANIPLARLGDEAEVARVAAFLLSPAASYVTGTIVAVDGGLVKGLP